MAYSAPYSYPYPGQFNNVKDGEDYCKRLYAALQDRDSRQDYVKDRSTDADLKALFIRPEWYGAKGDGATDDSTAISAAITAASGGGSVFFSNKTYVIGSAISIANGVHLCGVPGTETKIKASSTFTADAYMITNVAGAQFAGMRDIIIDGNYRASGVYLKNFLYGYFANVKIQYVTLASAWALWLDHWTVANSFYKLHILGCYGAIRGYNAGNGAGEWSGDNSFYDIRLQECVKGVVIDGFFTRDLFSNPMIDCNSDSAESRGIELGAEPDNTIVIGGAIENTESAGTGLLAATYGGHLFLNVKISGGFATERNIQSSNTDIYNGDVWCNRALNQDSYIVLSGRFSGDSPDGTMTWSVGDFRSSTVAGDGAYDIWEFPLPQPSGAVIRSARMYVATDDTAAELKLELYKATYSSSAGVLVDSETFTGSDYHNWTSIDYQTEAAYYTYFRASAKRSAGTYMFIYPLVLIVDSM